LESDPIQAVPLPAAEGQLHRRILPAEPSVRTPMVFHPLIWSQEHPPTVGRGLPEHPPPRLAFQEVALCQERVQTPGLAAR
jgi:hypothetical protein